MFQKTILPVAASSSQSPWSEPLATSDVVKHCNIQSTDDYGYAGEILKAAREYTEQTVAGGLKIKLQTYELTSTGFNETNKPVELPIGPLWQVESVGYVDTAGSTQTMASTDYTVARDQYRPGYIVPRYSRSWPAVRAQADAVKIRFVAGTTDIPEQAKHIVRLVCADWYEYRENQVEARISAPRQLAVDRLAEQLGWGFYG